MDKNTVRDTALSLLLRIEKEGGFSHLILSQAIDKAKMDERDEKLLTEMVYGTMERKLTLDFYLEPFIQQQKKLAEWVVPLLRMSVFQFVYLDKIPMYAIINEAVNIAKQRGHKGIASFVNGVLRNMERKGLPDISTIEDPAERLAIETSHPKWLVDSWISTYGLKTTTAICKENMTKKAVALRVNQLKITRAEMMAQLEMDGFEVLPSKIIKDAIIICKGNIVKTNYIRDGLVTIQDQSSMLAAQMVDTQEDMAVLDTCSAPGGKAGYLGEQMKNTGSIHAYDLHKNKIKLISQTADRLGITTMQTAQKDARNLQEIYEPLSFDRILVDAPCSGFGVIRSKPDIKYTKHPEDIKKLQQIQMEILDCIAPLLKTSGKLVYSTCTIGKLENEEVVKHFLEEHHEFQVDPAFLQEMDVFSQQDVSITPFGLQIFPQSFQSDGFFITRFTKLSS